MHLAVAGINHQPFHVRFINQLLKQPLPNALITPPAEPPMGVLPIAVACWQISPRRAGTQNPENGVKETTIVVRDTSPLAALPGQMWLKDLPSSIR